MSLNATSVELTDGLKTLSEVWEATRAVWTDGVAQEFESRYWRPLEGQTQDAVSAIERVAVLLAQVKRECT